MLNKSEPKGVHRMQCQIPIRIIFKEFIIWPKREKAAKPAILPDSDHSCEVKLPSHLRSTPERFMTVIQRRRTLGQEIENVFVFDFCFRPFSSSFFCSSFFDYSRLSGSLIVGSSKSLLSLNTYFYIKNADILFTYGCDTFYYYGSHHFYRDWAPRRPSQSHLTSSCVYHSSS